MTLRGGVYDTTALIQALVRKHRRHCRELLNDRATSIPQGKIITNTLVLIKDPSAFNPSLISEACSCVVSTPTVSQKTIMTAFIMITLRRVTSTKTISTTTTSTTISTVTMMANTIQGYQLDTMQFSAITYTSFVQSFQISNTTIAGAVHQCTQACSSISLPNHPC